MALLSSPFEVDDQEYDFLLRHDLSTFIERSFYELNPQTTYLQGSTSI